MHTQTHTQANTRTDATENILCLAMAGAQGEYCTPYKYLDTDTLFKKSYFRTDAKKPIDFYSAPHCLPCNA